MKFFSNRSHVLLRTARCTLLPALVLFSFDAAAADEVGAQPKASPLAPASPAAKPTTAAAPAPTKATSAGEESADEPAEAGEAEEETSDEAREDKPETTEEPAASPPVATPPVATPPVADEKATTSAEDDEASWMNLKAESRPLEDEDDRDKNQPQTYFRTLVLVEGTAKYGAFTIAEPGSDLNDEDPAVENLRAGNLAGQVTLGIMPGGSAFTMGGRVRGGSYVGERITRGNVAAEMLFGANFARSARGDNFVHILGGVGVEFIPGENQDLLSLSLSGGAVVNSVAFGAGLNIGANDEYAVAMFGMHIGWGQLY